MSVRPSVHSSTKVFQISKKFLTQIEVAEWYTTVCPHDPIQGQGQGHGSKSCENGQFQKIYLLCQCACNQMTNGEYNKTVSKF